MGDRSGKRRVAGKGVQRIMVDPKSSGDIRGDVVADPDLEDVGEDEGVICGEVGGERHKLIGMRCSKCSEERQLLR